jgi:histidyl-tRNA synthetase
MESCTSFSAPRGMRDFYPEDMVVRNRIFDAWRQSAELHGFVPYDACVVETLDLLKRKAGEEIVEQIYTFLDKSGRELALRPEMTPTLARMVAARQTALSFPIKWHTIAQCFRYERMTRGRKREHYQWNLDIVGEPAVSAEVEIIAAAVEALRRMGLTPADFKVHYNSRRLIGDLLVALGIPDPLHGGIFLVLDKRGKIDDENMRVMLVEKGLDAAAVASVFRLFEVHTLDQAGLLLPGSSASLDRLLEFQSLAVEYGLRAAIQFDIGVVRGLSYYTGIVFEAFDTARECRAIFGGGRYDNLLSDIGGKPETAVGLGFGDVVVADLLEARGKLPALTQGSGGLAVSYMQPEQRAAAMALATARRRSGGPVDLALSPEKAKHFFARAAKAGCAHAIYLGPDDLAKGTLRIKDLAAFTQSEVSISEFTGGALHPRV